ncbi:uncharacterized protein LOC120104725 [Phoenix dactylifera]|uniref:Uncharacterized protein LOC120104725 n=1 Tax=Phoenix dactylifera TaxID=42345 RepID=A0A8B8ZDU4_PHODC|nr:uncharacterized protein LOC120104725 [Phoenix dactylifera]
MELQNLRNGDPPSSELAEPNHGEHHLDPPLSPLRFPSDDVDSSCSTPYVSAPSSPGRGGVAGGYFFSAPTSPMHFILSSAGGSGGRFPSDSPDASVAGSFEFEFSARFLPAAAFATGSMTSADELFLNGQIRPMKLCSHLQRPQVLAPLLDLNEEEDDDDESERHPPEMAARGRDLKLRSRSIRRRARSHSPLRNAPLHWQMEVEEREDRAKDVEPVSDPKQIEAEAATLSVSASSFRSSSTSSSSSGRTSKKWVFLKDLLYRSKSEGRERGNTKEKFWHSISFLPYRQGLLGCLGFTSRSYGAINGIARTLHPISSK